MTRVILEGELLEKLKGLTGKVELLDARGRLVGVFDPTADAGARRVVSPYTDEQLSELTKDLSGSPLAEVLSRLEAS